jgi:hypothetical protein
MKIKSGFNAAKLLTLVLALTSLLVAIPASAVENSVQDRSHKSVGLLGFDVDGPGPIPAFVLCSGFVISDHAFATAAHCVVPIAPVAVSFVVTLEAGSPDDPVVPPGVFDLLKYNFSDFPILADTVVATGYQVHPNYDPMTLANDLAVIEFPAGTFSVRPVRLPEEGFLDRLDTIGVLYEVPVTLVGYGANESLGGSLFAIPGYRTRGSAIVTDLTEQSLILGTDEIRNSITRAGDSGSPQIMMGRAVSVTSFMGNKQRLDTPLTVWFLSNYTGKNN